jgi:hypothetical protein
VFDPAIAAINVRCLEDHLASIPVTQFGGRSM